MYERERERCVYERERERDRARSLKKIGWSRVSCRSESARARVSARERWIEREGENRRVPGVVGCVVKVRACGGVGYWRT